MIVGSAFCRDVEETASMILICAGAFAESSAGRAAAEPARFLFSFETPAVTMLPFPAVSANELPAMANAPVPIEIDNQTSAMSAVMPVAAPKTIRLRTWCGFVFVCSICSKRFFIAGKSLGLYDQYTPIATDKIFFLQGKFVLFFAPVPRLFEEHVE